MKICLHCIIRTDSEAWESNISDSPEAKTVTTKGDWRLASVDGDGVDGDGDITPNGVHVLMGAKYMGGIFRVLRSCCHPPLCPVLLIMATRTVLSDRNTMARLRGHGHGGLSISY